MEQVTIKSEKEIELMRVAGALTARVLEAVEKIIVPNITTADIDDFCRDYIINTLKAEPGSTGQYGYPFTVNTSPNNVVCHGMPSPNKVLKNGDIVNVDVTVRSNGYYGDSSKMYCVGNVASHARRLIDITEEALYNAIKIVKPGVTLGDIGHTIQQHAEKNNYSVVEEYCGHGIGRKMHEPPHVLHYGKPGEGLALKEGMTFTIEPMINQGKRHVKVLADKWTVVTKDRMLSAQCEHTILVTANGFEVLTLRESERHIFAPKDGTSTEKTAQTEYS